MSLTGKLHPAVRVIFLIHLQARGGSWLIHLTQLDKVGKPDIRKYCSPLQALFWLAQDDMLNISGDNLVIKSKMFGILVYIPFSVDSLIDITWKGKLFICLTQLKVQNGMIFILLLTG